MKKCIDCAKDIEYLCDFPGPRCLTCYEKTLDGKPLEKPDFVGAINIRKGKRR